MKRLTMIATLLMLAGCEGVGQTPEEMVKAAEVCRKGGLEVTVMETMVGERYVTCGAPTEPEPKPAGQQQEGARIDVSTYDEPGRTVEGS